MLNFLTLLGVYGICKAMWYTEKKKRLEWQKDLKNSSLQNYNKTHIEKVKAKKANTTII